MSRARPIFSFLLAALIPSVVLSWGWRDAVNLTMEKNELIKAREQEISAAKFGVSVARSAFFPSITLLGGWQEFLGQHKELEYRAFIGPRLRWSIYKGGKYTKGVDMASSQADQVELGRALTSINLNSQLRQAFANAIYAKHSIDLAKKIEARRLENVKFTEIRYRGGLEFKWVYMSAKVKWEEAKVRTEEAMLDQQTALKDLEQITGPLPIKSVDELTADDFYAMDNAIEPDSVIAELDKHPEIELQKMKTEESLTRISYTNADRYPELALIGDTSFSGLSSVGPFPYLSAGIYLSMPIFAGFRYQSSTDAARAQYQQQRNEFAQAKLNLAAKIQKTYQSFIVAKKLLEVSRMDLEVANDRARVVSQQYRSGLTTFLDWERSQDDWVTAERAMLSNVRTYGVSRANFEEAIGMELTTE